MKKLPLYMLIAVAAAAVFLLSQGKGSPVPDAPDETLSGEGEPAIGGAFTLTDHTGKIVRDADYRGKVMVVFFGFTHCPDICPVTIATLSGTLDALGAQADKVAPLFITVDPARDTPKVLKDYIAPFNAHIVGLTGTAPEIKVAVDAYKAYAARSESVNAGAVPGDAGDPADDDEADDADDAHGHEHAGGHGGENYTVDHSGFVYLMGKDGKYLRHFPYNVSEKELTQAVREYLK